jgi:2-polyprenyl-3-methyl-5-hydroxy-6-metoxy-1,4-benzoquinol methylase
LYGDEKNLGSLKGNPRIKIMLEMANSLRLTDKNILDIGCYDGTFLSLLKNQGNKLFGLDASDWAIAEARKKGLKIHQYFFNDQAHLPFDDNSIDIIIAGEIIEHIYDTDFFLEEIRRVLKSNGKLLISTPNIASLGKRILLLFGISPLIELSLNEPGSVGHIRYFTFKTLGKLIRKHKFKIISFQSDCVNFSYNGKIKSALLAKFYPKFGASIIFLAKKI